MTDRLGAATLAAATKALKIANDLTNYRSASAAEAPRNS